MIGRSRTWNSYRQLPLNLVRYLAVVTFAGPAAAIAWFQLGPATDRSDRWLHLAILTLLAALAERFPICLTHKTYLNVASAVYVAMLLTVPLPTCGLAALAAVFVAQNYRFKANPGLGLAEPLFNTGQTAFYVTGAAMTVYGVERWATDLARTGNVVLSQVLVASIALHLLNSALVAGASARHLGTGWFRVWYQNVLIDIGPHAGMTLVGVCAAQLAYATPLLIPALAVPAVLVHRAVQHSVQLRKDTREALASLVEIVELRDPYTAGHSRRVAQLSRDIAIEMGLTNEEADQIEDAGNVHDLGKVAIDPTVLLKPGKLTNAEMIEMKRHPVFGAEVLGRFESYGRRIDVVRSHHESWDGTGYPDGLMGTAIPIGARILAVADTFDALTSDRPYRSGMSTGQATAILADGAGKQWDPDVVAVLLRILGEGSAATMPALRLSPADAADHASNHIVEPAVA